MKHILQLLIIFSFVVFAGMAFTYCKNNYPDTYWPVFMLGIYCNQICRWVKENVK